MGKTVGILGGMGPEATSDLFRKILNFTEAETDQEHIPIIIENNVRIPDRTKYILGQGESPLKHLIKSAVKLELMGAQLLAMPCNTAHYFYDRMVEFLDVPFVNMIDEVGKVIYDSLGSGAKVGLLATKGTYAGDIYEKYCKKYDITIVRPSQKNRDIILNLIYDIKKGKKNFEIGLIKGILDEFNANDIRAIILGCTELPLLFNNLDIEELNSFNFIDTTEILAQRIVEMAK